MALKESLRRYKVRIINCAICNGYVKISKTRSIEIEVYKSIGDDLIMGKEFQKKKVCVLCFEELSKGETISPQANNMWDRFKL